MNKVIIYCDGGCRNNGKPNNIGGWGVFLSQGEHTKEIYGSARDTTNNKMELTAAIQALKAIKRNTVPIEIHCDSAYVVNGMTSWVAGWIRRGWIKSDKKPVENKELWQQLVALKNQMNEVTFIKVKSHANSAGNNKADALVNQAMDEAN